MFLGYVLWTENKGLNRTKVGLKREQRTESKKKKEESLNRTKVGLKRIAIVDTGVNDHPFESH